MLDEAGHGLGAVVGRHHAVAVVLEGRLDDFAHGRDIVHHQHQFLVSARQRRLGGVRNSFALAGGGEMDFELRARADLAVELEETAQAGDNLFHRGQPEAGALARRLGAEERLEDFLLQLRGNARAVVGHGEHDIASGWQGRVVAGRTGRLAGCQGRFAREVVRGNRDRAAVRHGIAGIHAEVEQHLIQLRGIAAHRPQVGAHMGDAPDVRREGVLHHPAEVGDQMPDLEDDGAVRPSAREGEDLLDHARAAPGAGFDNVDDLVGVGIRGLRAQQLHRHENGREHVVQIVGHAAGQRADALEALGAKELRLQLFELRLIRAHRENAAGAAVRVSQQRPVAVGDHVAAHEPEGQQVAAPFAGPEGLRLRPLEQRRIAHVDEVRQPLAARRRRRRAEHGGGAGITKLHHARQVGDHDGLGGLVDQRRLLANLLRRLLDLGALAVQAGVAVEPRDGLHASAQFRRVEGLDHEIIRAATDAGQARLAVIQRGDHDHGDLGQGGRCAQPATDLEAVHAGHHHVEQDEVGEQLGGELQRRGAIFGFDEPEVRVVQQLGERVAVCRVVLNDKDGGGRGHGSVMREWGNQRRRVGTVGLGFAILRRPGYSPAHASNDRASEFSHPPGPDQPGRVFGDFGASRAESGGGDISPPRPAGARQ